MYTCMEYTLYDTIYSYEPPWGPGGLSRECAPPYPQRDRKRRLNGAVCRNHRIKRLVPCRCLDGHVKEPYEMSMAWEPDRRSNFFFNPPAHLCAVTYMTEISLIVTFNNQFTYLTLMKEPCKCMCTPPPQKKKTKQTNKQTKTSIVPTCKITFDLSWNMCSSKPLKFHLA